MAVRALVVVAIVAGCAHRAPRPAACNAAIRGAPPSAMGVLRARTITAVEVTGTDPELAKTLEGMLATKAGDNLDHERVVQDVDRLLALGVASDVRVGVEARHGGAEVTFEVKPEPLIDRVDVTGTGAGLPELRRLHWLAGTPYEPQRIERIAAQTQATLVANGYLDAKIAVQRASAPGVALCVRAEPGRPVVIDRFEFPGRTAVSARELVEKLRGEREGFNHVGGVYDASVLAADNALLLAPYYERGRLDTVIDPPQARREGDHLVVTIPIHESPVYRIGSVRVLAPGGSTVPLDLAPGDVYTIWNVQAAAARLRALAGDDATVVPKTTIDYVHHSAAVELQIEWRWPWHALRLVRSR
jgi:outer membrane protein assembly factor BamA